MTGEDDTGAQKRHAIPMEDLRSFVDDFPALLWRIEIARSRIEFLNDHSLHPLGDSARLFLKNKAFRKQMLLPEDAHLLDAFLDAVREGRTMATVFRVHTPADSIMWLKLTGAVNSSDPQYYYGYLLDIGDTVEVIREIQETDAAARMRIGNVPTPVMLMDHETHHLKQANAAARDLFGLPRPLSVNRPKFIDLCPAAEEDPLNAILEDLPLERKWTGSLEFCTTQGEPFEADATLQWVRWRQNALIRVSVNPHSEVNRQAVSEEHQPVDRDVSGRLREIFSGAPDIAAMLARVLEQPDIARRCNAVMLSDILTRSNKVFVTGAGAPLADMPPGEEFSYRGTIAEDIARFNLDHLVVDDTMDSIKPIDWALFIPRGLRSYFAKPFYENGELQVVLILCSTEPDRFVDLAPDTFDSILVPLYEAIRARRKEHG